MTSRCEASLGAALPPGDHLARPDTVGMLFAEPSSTHRTLNAHDCKGGGVPSVYPPDEWARYRRQMATDAEWRRCIGQRIRELRALKGWSLTDLSRHTKGLLAKSTISNYEQALRMPGPEEASILGDAFGESPAHVLCLDEGMPALSKFEAKLITDLRVLPEDQRHDYAKRIALLALAYKAPIPTERVMETAYSPSRRPKAKVSR